MYNFEWRPSNFTQLRSDIQFHYTISPQSSIWEVFSQKNNNNVPIYGTPDNVFFFNQVELSKGDAVVTWFKDGQEISFSDHYQLSIDGKVQRLLIYNCQTEDIGVYRAVVGKTECSAKLEVRCSKLRIILKPVVNDLEALESKHCRNLIKLVRNL